MIEINLSADDLVGRLLKHSEHSPLCLLDSCGVGYGGSHLLLAGIKPVRILEISENTPAASLRLLDRLIREWPAVFFTLSYDLGRKLNGIVTRHGPDGAVPEPDIFAAAFSSILIHDYRTGRSCLTGNGDGSAELLRSLRAAEDPGKVGNRTAAAVSELPRAEYESKVGEIRDLIRAGETYQTNLTQKIAVDLAGGVSPQDVFARLRRNHPAAFSAFLSRGRDHVVSISPERFFSIDDFRPFGDSDLPPAVISASPVKGTRPRGTSASEDLRLKSELIGSGKDRAENIMIVDLLRNDLGRVCEYGSVTVDELCGLESHPSLFHLVSTISGTVTSGTALSDILEAVFPCGSITGCPKIRTMRIIDELEPSRRGLSMGAIGYACRNELLQPLGGSLSNAAAAGDLSTLTRIDLSVAIRTIVIRNGTAVFNVGGGIVIDSDPAREYAESMDKARAILAALDADPEKAFTGP